MGGSRHKFLMVKWEKTFLQNMGSKHFPLTIFSMMHWEVTQKKTLKYNYHKTGNFCKSQFLCSAAFDIFACF